MDGCGGGCVVVGVYWCVCGEVVVVVEVGVGEVVVPGPHYCLCILVEEVTADCILTMTS